MRRDHIPGLSIFTCSCLRFLLNWLLVTFQIQNESGFDLKNTTEPRKPEHPYYSEIKHGSINIALKSESKFPSADKNSVSILVEKNLLSENIESYAKLSLINHSPYVGLAPIHSPNSLSSERSKTRNIAVYTEINEVDGEEGLKQESCINVKDYSENKNSSPDNDSSYTKMESFCPESYAQLQKKIQMKFSKKILCMPMQLLIT